ncbi:hypothetical protein [Bradyrhizobium sp. 172]|uniref:hypothetical protein n=1 Tax=Bradyrhizobium sp. 172 TaxID=2782643 RepID=UPI001FFE40C6|nr:hypothetical protein [Bradyrhizobium sp. 172]UPJ94877.1 hypothetical protein IVB07_31380 [Bradyrhizobium sp. 172]
MLFTACRDSGLLPVVDVLSAYWFRRDAARLGCCDVIATRNTSIAKAEAAMIAGVVEEVGLDRRNRCLRAKMTRNRRRTAHEYMAYFQGPSTDWKMVIQRLSLRREFSGKRLPIYAVPAGDRLVADQNSVLEFRRDIAPRDIQSIDQYREQAVRLDWRNPRALGRDHRYTRPHVSFSSPIGSICRSVSSCDKSGLGRAGDRKRMASLRIFIVGLAASAAFGVVPRNGHSLARSRMIGRVYGSFCAAAGTTGELARMGGRATCCLAFIGRQSHRGSPRSDEKKVAERYPNGTAVSIGRCLKPTMADGPSETRPRCSVLLSPPRIIAQTTVCRRLLSRAAAAM